MEIIGIIMIIIGIIIGTKAGIKLYDEVSSILIHKRFKERDIYVIQTTYLNNISNVECEAFYFKERAIQFIEEKLTEEEKQDNINKKKQGLLWNDEFLCKNIKYTIYHLKLMF